MQNKPDRGFIVAITACAIISIVCMIALMFVAAHFIRKYW